LAENIVVNSVFPRVMADFCQHNHIGFIHITTDCVFDGRDGFYTENSIHNALDDYGRTKSLGEPNNCMVIRTSIIGPEKGTKKSLVEWLLSQNHKGVRGFTNHMWNGVTTMELANVLNFIIRRGLVTKGLYHIYSDDVTKAELLHKMIKHWGLDIQVDEQPAPDHCNRTLRTVKDLCSIVEPRSLDDMLQDIRPFINVPA
jgi:dTDP-4-dehydrorhamnose reductase